MSCQSILALVLRAIEVGGEESVEKLLVKYISDNTEMDFDGEHLSVSYASGSLELSEDVLWGRWQRMSKEEQDRVKRTYLSCRSVLTLQQMHIRLCKCPTKRSWTKGRMIVELMEGIEAGAEFPQKSEISCLSHLL